MTRILTIIALLFATPAWAGLFDKVFGYSSFEDCVLGELSDKTGDTAAKIIRMACRDKFPRAAATKPTSPDKQKKQGFFNKQKRQGRFEVLHSFWKKDEYTMKVKNTTGKKVTSIKLRLDAFPKGKRPQCRYENSVEVKSWAMTVAVGEAIQLSHPFGRYSEKGKDYRYCFWVEGFSTALW